jgi:hypothetical protein
MARHLSASALTALSAALLLGAAGCSAPEETAPIEVVSTPEATGEPIPLDAPLHSSGAFAFDQWPSACALTDEATVQSVLPGATEVAQQAESMELSILSLGGDSEDKGPHTVPEASCTTSTGFDADGLRLEDGNVVVNFTAQVLAAGNAEFVERNGELPSGEKVKIGDATCASSAQMYTCALEDIVFSIMIDARPYQQYTDADGSIYTVDGEEVDYSEDTDGFMTMSDEKILRPVVESAVERLAA